MLFAGCGGPPIATTDETQYLVFVLNGATGLYDQTGPDAGDASAIKGIIDSNVATLISQIGNTGDGKTRQLGFSLLVVPWILDVGYPGKMETTIAAAAQVALERNVAFHISIESHYFWSSRPDLWNFFDAGQPGYNPANIANVEWSDWNQTGYKWRFINWGEPQDLGAPHMCYLSPAVQSEVARLGAKIGAATRAAMKTLSDAGHPELFAGLTVDSEPSLDNYSVVDAYDPAMAMLMGLKGAPKVRLGYCSLTALGYSASNPPADLGAAGAQVNQRFIQSWAAAVAGTGVPTNRLYTHIAASPTDTLLVDFNSSPMDVAFIDSARPGFSTYPVGPLQNSFDPLVAALTAQGTRHWGGTEAAPFNPMGGVDTYDYLRRHYSAGAMLVVFNVGAIGMLGPALSEAVYGSAAISGYRRFLTGQ
jgi:hypothetical protein